MVARCRKVTHAWHQPRDFDNVNPRVDDCMQAEALDCRVDMADDRVPGFDSTDNQVVCSPLEQEAGWGAVEGLGAGEAEGKG